MGRPRKRRVSIRHNLPDLPAEFSSSSAATTSHSTQVAALHEPELLSDGSIKDFPSFSEWLPKAIPKIGKKAAKWDWAWLKYLRQKLRDVTLGRQNRLALSVPPQHGKPVYNASMILMHTGERKRIDEIVVGDRVITHRGRARTVLAVHVQGDLPCVRIKTELGRETVAALDHPFMTPNGWVNAGELKAGDVLATVPCPLTESVQGGRCVEEFRLAGYFVGDGTTTHSRNGSTCNASITNIDPALQADFCVVAKACGFGIRRLDQPHRATSFSFSDGVRDWLREAGLAGCSAHTKRVPAWVFSGNAQQIAHFLGAYYDCDGCLSGRGMARNGGLRKDPCTEFYSVHKALLVDVQHLLLRLGIRSRLSMKRGQYKDAVHISWRLGISSVDDVSKFATRVPLIGERGDRLRAAAVPRTRFDPQFIEDPVVSVEDAGVLPCRCLTVEEDSTFTSDDLVVHNTSVLTVGYVLWRMLRTPGLRVAICCHTQTYAEKNVKKIRDIAKRLGIEFGGINRQDEFEFENGSTIIARGAGAKIAGESIDLCVIDDPFGNREEADSPVIQQKVYEWYMDDVTPRVQDGGAIIVVHTRWGPGDLIGRIKESEEGPEWEYVTFKAIAEEDDPLGRQVGEALCPERYPIHKLLQLRRTLQIGFESLYQGNPIPRGGTWFQRDWFTIVDCIPERHFTPEELAKYKSTRFVRYWDLACLVAGTMIETLNGSMPIERVTAGEYVLTRYGYRRVERAWRTKMVDGLLTTRFANGSSITATPEHRVWTENRGWIPFTDLAYGDSVLHTGAGGELCQYRRIERDRHERRIRNAWSSMESCTGGDLERGTSRHTGGIVCRGGISVSFFTARCGDFIAAKSPPAMTSTTRTRITTTIRSRISSVFPRMNTRDCITDLLNSMLRQTPWNIINGLAGSNGSTSQAAHTPASSAARPERPGTIAFGGTVPTGAATSTVRDKRIPVYDLEVEGAHEFFANGILVHNSSRKDTACYTSGVLMAKVHVSYEPEIYEYYILDVIRGRWTPGERNDIMKQTAQGDETRGPAFEQTWFEKPVFDKEHLATRAIMSKMAGHRAGAHNVSGLGSKEMRAEPVADAAKARLIKLVRGPWVAAYLTELEGFPKATFRDQVDSTSGALAMLTWGPTRIFFAGERAEEPKKDDLHEVHKTTSIPTWLRDT